MESFVRALLCCGLLAVEFLTVEFLTPEFLTLEFLNDSLVHSRSTFALPHAKFSQGLLSIMSLG